MCFITLLSHNTNQPYSFFNFPYPVPCCCCACDSGTDNGLGTEAAQWVWDSLWSARRHARMDILDVVLFDEQLASEQEGGASPCLEPPKPFASMRWLFTAKNGRVMKKSSHNTSLGALKQALLGRALLRRGSSEGTSTGTNSTNERRSSSATGGCIFATALLRSGESVPLDEDRWTALVVREGGREDGAVAVTALAPAGGDLGIEMSRRGGAAPQRFTCEYRAKLDNKRTAPTRAHPAAATDFAVTTKPIEASMTTYVLVARGVLRDRDEQQNEPQRDRGEAKQTAGGDAADAATSATANLLDERLLSRAKTTNREVEAKLRAVVQWVQETRGVYVLNMAATFIVVLSSGGNSAHKPGVWLEQALHVRMVPKNGSAPAPALTHAPFAEPPRVAPINGHDPVPACDGERHPCQEGNDTRRQPPAETAAEDIVPVGKTTAASGTAPLPQLPPLPTTTAPASVDGLPGTAEDQHKSTTEMLSAAADAVLSAGQSSDSTSPQVRYPPTADVAVVGAVQLRSGSAGEAGGNWRRPLAVTTTRARCSGDFCTYCGGGGEGPGSSDGSPPQDEVLEETTGSKEAIGSEAGSREGIGEAGVNWTDIGMSDDKSGSALLEVRNKQQDSPLPGDGERGKDNGILFSLTFRSVGLARVEAKQGHDAYWGEDLRRCWREGGCGAAGGLEELSPALIYQEARRGLSFLK